MEELFLFLLDKRCSMTQIPGVTIRKNANGKITHITINVEQQKELARPVLERLKEVDEDVLTLEKSLTSSLTLVDQLFDADEKHKN